MLLQLEQLVLRLPQELGALSKVLAQGLVLECQFIEFFLHRIILSSRQVAVLIAFEDVNLSLQLVIFSVQEIHLTLKLLDALFVLLILVLQIKFLQILGRRIKLVQP